MPPFAHTHPHRRGRGGGRLHGRLRRRRIRCQLHPVRLRLLRPRVHHRKGRLQAVPQRHQHAGQGGHQRRQLHRWAVGHARAGTQCVLSMGQPCAGFRRAFWHVRSAVRHAHTPSRDFTWFSIHSPASTTHIQLTSTSSPMPKTLHSLRPRQDRHRLHRLRRQRQGASQGGGCQDLYARVIYARLELGNGARAPRPCPPASIQQARTATALWLLCRMRPTAPAALSMDGANEPPGP